MGVASKLSAPNDCQEPMIVGPFKSIRITPASGVAKYATPYLVTTSLILSESNPSAELKSANTVSEDVLIILTPSCKCPTTSAFVFES